MNADAVFAALDEIEAAHEKLAALPLDGLSSRELLMVLERRERLAWRQPVVDHALIARLSVECSPGASGARNLAAVLSRRLRISAGDARRRIAEAEDLGPRTGVTGEPLEPMLPTVAEAQAAGRLGGEHVKVIRGFFDGLPQHVDFSTRRAAEADLARFATELPPEELRQAAARLAALLDQDGEFSDADRARRRGLTVGRQGVDGMSKVSGVLDPEARAALDAVLAKFAAPGMCNPDAERPRVDGEPGVEEVRVDARTTCQRNHDALVAMCRALLASGRLGRKRGLPATIIVSTTLAELESGAGQAATGGGSLLPMRDVIRMAAHAHHYLVVYDNHTEIPLYLGRSRRTASAGQRIVLHNKDIGCSFPGCTARGYECEVHHAECDWADGGKTDVSDLTLACGPHNRLVGGSGWRTRKRRDGRTEWIPPPELDGGQARTNRYHHPGRYLVPDDGDGEPDG